MESAVPTPTPGEADMAYADPQANLPAPPPEAAPVSAAEAVSEIPAPEQAAIPAPAPAKAKPAKVTRRSYKVKSGDSLWNISGKPKTLGDRFRWPLLFKANRKSIKDPDLIEPGQSFTWKASYSMSEIEEAIQKAKDTPKFVPHTGVRKELPVQY
jgi:nucleoid-associated protein YgaU